MAWIPAPEASWEDLRPYVRSRVVPFVRDGRLETFVCAGVADRTTVEPYDEDLGQYVFLLLHQGIVRDRRIQRALAGVNERFVAEHSDFATLPQDELRQVYWQDLLADPAFTKWATERVDRARRDGRLRCWLCDLCAGDPEGCGMEPPDDGFLRLVVHEPAPALTSFGR